MDLCFNDKSFVGIINEYCCLEVDLDFERVRLQPVTLLLLSNDTIYSTHGSLTRSASSAAP